MGETFIYTQLDTSDTSSFRILELQPGDKEAPIVCNLVQARLDAKPGYEAISYVWGSDKRPIPINCNGKRLYITENLRNALVRVRFPDRSRSVWADSVCIDQGDLKEKGHQVQSMGKIYSNASRVLICLGDDDGGHARKAISLVEDVSNMIDKTLSECEQTYDSFPKLDPDDPWFQDERWPSWDSLLSRPWFRRGWVLQEAALAKEAVVLWGEAECGWIQLMDTIIWFRARIRERRSMFIGEVDFPGRVLSLLHLRKGAHKMRLRPLTRAGYASERLGVPEFMGAARALILSNPEDRVFAFLAILDKISQNTLNIKADYSKTLQSVYTEFALAYLQATRNLNFLQCVQHTNESLKLGTRSWVPLWDIDEWDSVQTIMWARQQDSSAQFTLEPGSDTPKLTVQALLFDTIRFASEPLRIETGEDVARLWQTIRHMDASADVSEFLQALCGRYHSDNWEPWKLERSAYGRYLHASSSSSSKDGDFPHVHDCIRTFTKGRRFALTNKEGYYGLVPAVAKESDICAFLLGASAPFSLRQTGNVQEYKVLGDAFFLNTETCNSDQDIYSYRRLKITDLTPKSSFEEDRITLI